MPEEPTGTGSQKEEPGRSLEERLDRLEREVLRENRWWRGGLIAALVFLGLAILVGGHHRHHRRPHPIAMAPMGMGMPYWGFAPPPLGLPLRTGRLWMAGIWRLGPRTIQCTRSTAQSAGCRTRNRSPSTPGCAKAQGLGRGARKSPWQKRTPLLARRDFVNGIGLPEAKTR